MNFYLNYIFSRNFNLIFYSFSKYIIVCGLFIIFLVTFAYKSHIKYMKGDVVVSETPSDSAPTPSILVCVKQVNLLSTLECDEAPKHFLPATTINSPHYQGEFMV